MVDLSFNWRMTAFLALAVLVSTAAAPISDSGTNLSGGNVKIGVLTDLAGPTAMANGKGSVVAAELAAEDNTRVKCINTGKQFGDCAVQARNRPHATKNHAGIQQAVDPVDMRQKMITQHAHAEGKQHETQACPRVTQLAP